ncbi:MAG: hypothetical protein U5J99_04645 [Parvularculaceae bacterium]|nr:hypothetical protein [Parvularculaceae bacterium]
MTKDVRKEQVELLKFEKKLAGLAAFVAAGSATAASAAGKVNAEATMKAYADISNALVHLADVTTKAHAALEASVAGSGGEGAAGEWRNAKESAVGGCAITAGDWIILVSYAAAVFVAAALAHIAKSSSLRTASIVIAMAWAGGVLWYFFIAPLGLTWGYSLINLSQAAFFWRQSRGRVFPLPLFVLSGLSVVLYLLTTLSGISYWWVAFASNRLFDLMLLYIAGCALFRIVRMQHKKKGAPMARPQSSQLFAVA